MKFQLVILSVLFVSALAWPLPDEEVSPVKAVVQPKEVEVQKQEEKPVEAVKPESRSASEPAGGEQAPKQALPAEIPPIAPALAGANEKKPEAPVKLDLSANAPDAEIAQALPEKKEEKKAGEKQVRIDDKVEEAKALPVVNAPAAGLQEQKQIVDELKPAVQEVRIEGISAEISAQPSEQKKEELSVAEDSSIVKSEGASADAAPSEAAPAEGEAKKEELPARQERQEVEDAKPLEPVAIPLKEAEPAVKDLKSEENAAPAEKALEAEKKRDKPTEPIDNIQQIAPASQGAALEQAEKKLEEPQAPAGDIPQQQSDEVSNPNQLKSEQLPQQQQQQQLQEQPQQSAQPVPQAKLILEPSQSQAQTPAEQQQQTQSAQAAPESESGEKKLEDNEQKKSEEKKNSAESNESDSKESEESKENKTN